MVADTANFREKLKNSFIEYQNFVKRTLDLSTMTLTKAIHWIQADFGASHPGKHCIIFLVIDEALLVDIDPMRSKTNLVCLMSMVSRAFGDFDPADFMCILTSLSAELISIAKSGSGRRINYVPLPALSEVDVATALGGVLPRMKSKATAAVLRLLAAHCMGHGRSIGIVSTHLMGSPIYDHLDWSAIYTQSLVILSGSLESVEDSLIMAALRGVALPKSHTLDGLTIQQRIFDGSILVFGDNEASSCKVIIQPFQIYKWAKQCIEVGQDESTGTNNYALVCASSSCSMVRI